MKKTAPKPAPKLTIGQRIRQIRQAKGIRAVTLAWRADMSPVQLRQYEHGIRKSMYLHIFMNICKALGVSMGCFDDCADNAPARPGEDHQPHYPKGRLQKKFKSEPYTLINELTLEGKAYMAKAAGRKISDKVFREKLKTRKIRAEATARKRKTNKEQNNP